ncbi:hypothetical protein H0H92_007393 [Tricholoma furcatifolium]|nr:hypothetical protein H0H92_007393 [Tricholoma furcatifolium]
MATSDRGHDEQAQDFWSVYVTEAEKYDTDIMETWKADMDSTLIFAGLFSAMVTAFLLDSCKRLENPGISAQELLSQILAVQIVSASLNTSVIQLPTALPTTTSEQSASATLINVLWFLSLTFSLAAALYATLVQKWIRDYLQRIRQTNQPQSRATIRGILFSGSVKWKLNDVVEMIPTLLHLSVFLFFAGLCAFLWSVSVSTASAVVAVIISSTILYGIATMAPLVDNFAPYQTPLSSLLWHVIHQRSDQVIGPAEPKSLSEAREGSLVSPPFAISLHQRMEAIVWLYQKTTDRTIGALKLEEFMRSIPELLSSEDGRISWRMFHSKGARMAQDLESRIVHLLKSCIARDPYKYESIILCIESLLAISSIPGLVNAGAPHNIELNKIVKKYTPWRDSFQHRRLITQAVCLEVLLRRRSLLWQISRMQRHLNSRFRDLSKMADQAIRDINDMRHILEGVLQEPRDILIDHKEDIAFLLKVYFGVVESKAIILIHWFKEMHQIILSEPCHIPFLSWYYSLPPLVLRISYEGVLDSSGAFELNIYAHQVLAHLRHHRVYPELPDLILGSDIAHKKRRSHPLGPPVLSSYETWFPLTEKVSSRPTFHSGTRAFWPFSTDTPGKFPPVNLTKLIDPHLRRELQPISALLDVLHASPPTGAVTIRIEMPPQTPLDSDLSWQLTNTLVEGPLSFVVSMLEAIMEDKGSTVGLLDLVTTLKAYSPEVRTWDWSTINKQLKTGMYLPISSSSPSMSEGCQVFLVGALQNILAWEQGLPKNQKIPISGDIRGQLFDLLKYLSHERSVDMAERNLTQRGTDSLWQWRLTESEDLEEVSNQPATSLRDRAHRVYEHATAKRRSKTR